MLARAGSDSACATRRAPTSVRVLYTGTVPDPFRVGREIVVDGSVRGGTFVASPGSMVTKCPSKYTAKPKGQ